MEMQVTGGWLWAQNNSQTHFLHSWLVGGTAFIESPLELNCRELFCFLFYVVPWRVPLQRIRHIPLHPHCRRTSQLRLVVSLADVISVTEVVFCSESQVCCRSEGGRTSLVLQLLISLWFCFWGADFWAMNTCCEGGVAVFIWSAPSLSIRRGHLNLSRFLYILQQVCEMAWLLA